jgi:hypothetical protein
VALSTHHCVLSNKFLSRTATCIQSPPKFLSDLRNVPAHTQVLPNICSCSSRQNPSLSTCGALTRLIQRTARRMFSCYQSFRSLWAARYSGMSPAFSSGSSGVWPPCSSMSIATDLTTGREAILRSCVPPVCEAGLRRGAGLQDPWCGPRFQPLPSRWQERAPEPRP